MLAGFSSRLTFPRVLSRWHTTHRQLMAAPKVYDFGPLSIVEDHVFLTTDLSYAFVNLKPVLPGHVLISPKRIVPRFVDLTKEEVVDLWSLAQRVGPTLEEYLCADSLTLAIQDGPAAGQTVPHVHIHCLPRKFGDFKNNDDIYDEINENSKLLASEKQKLDEEEDRKPRSSEEMSTEAHEFRMLFL